MITDYDEYEKLLELSQQHKPTTHFHMPKMTTTQYVEEFNLIAEKRSNLSSKQRSYVKHIVYMMAAKGQVTLKETSND